MRSRIDMSGNAEKATLAVRASLQTLAPSLVGDVAHEGADYIRQRYLRGQALNYITGETYGHVKAYYDRALGEWWIRPGVGIPGSHNYLARWVGTDREFMKPGFEAFLNQRKKVEDAVRDRVEASWAEGGRP